MSLKELHKIETTKSSWRDFVEYSIQTSFYKEAKEKTGSLVESIQLTLFHDYLSTFSEEEKYEYLSNEKEFLRSAVNFVNILEGARYAPEGYNAVERSLFLGMIKGLLREQLDGENQIVDMERYHFYRCIIRFCSNLEYIERVYDRYKNYIAQVSGV
ncbi:hypothetical protein LEP1GSC050_1395 [Leptospira broomii serovar Hurstbridge str. 5399]|uniref:Uncharacterized protein n=1 Tax=Leptospira broomii serovar Hurstbridge str. 5399 TaxID=1049789 RepID=T0GE67_9LEPT|nr:hypothetical protein [Leptospira broomii]EQA43703.1 hypothetical protein LEP1GSC050_1395 [Leptospira broomii serovar Hurstbridge str. 5399]